MAQEMKPGGPFLGKIADTLLNEIADPLFDEMVDPFFNEMADPLLREIADTLLNEIAGPLFARNAQPIGRCDYRAPNFQEKKKRNFWAVTFFKTYGSASRGDPNCDTRGPPLTLNFDDVRQHEILKPSCKSQNKVRT